MLGIVLIAEAVSLVYAVSVKVAPSTASIIQFLSDHYAQAVIAWTVLRLLSAKDGQAASLFV